MGTAINRFGGGRGGRFTYENIGETERKGIEISLAQSLLNDRLRLREGLSWVDTEVTKTSATNTYRKGRDIVEVPRYKITLGAEYDINPNITVFANARFQGKQYLSYRHDAKHDSHEVVDIGLKANYKGFHFNAGINNLFDKTYYNYMSDAENPLDRTYDIANGRNVYAEIRYKY